MSKVRYTKDDYRWALALAARYLSCESGRGSDLVARLRAPTTDPAYDYTSTQLLAEAIERVMRERAAEAQEHNKNNQP